MPKPDWKRRGKKQQARTGATGKQSSFFDWATRPGTPLPPTKGALPGGSGRRQNPRHHTTFGLPNLQDPENTGRRFPMGGLGLLKRPGTRECWLDANEGSSPPWFLRLSNCSSSSASSALLISILLAPR